MKILNKVAIFLCTGFVLISLYSCSRTDGRFSGEEFKRETGILSVSLKDVSDVNVLESADIDAENGIVTIIPKDGIDRRHLKFFAVLSEGALSQPAMGIITDFSKPVRFTIISESRGTTRVWTVKVITKNDEAFFTTIEDVKDKKDVSVLVSNDIDVENKKVSIVVKERADRSKLKLFASISEGAEIKPALGVLTDFSLPVEYTITSEDGRFVNKWTITVSPEEFVDNDSGFDYELAASEWTLDAAKSDVFDSWKEGLWIAEENVDVSKGKLRIAADLEDNQYTGGKLQSKFDVGDNVYIKVRARTSDALARLRVFLALGDDILIMESIPGMNKAYNSSLLPVGINPLDSKKTVVGTELNTDYHVYGFERRKEFLRFYFDGQTVWEYEIPAHSDLGTKALPVVLGIEEISGTKPDDTKLPEYLMVDYVKIYNAVDAGPFVPVYGENIVKNPGFESAIGDDHPEGWTVKKTSGRSQVWVFRDVRGRNRSRSRFHFGMVEGTSVFEYTILQKLENIPDGLYRLEVWAYVVNGKNAEDPDPVLFVKGNLNMEKEVVAITAIGNASDENAYGKYVIDNIYVSGGDCEIGVTAKSLGKGLYRVFLDDFSFTKVNY